MRHVLRARTRFVGSVLLSVFVVALTVTCVTDSRMTTAEMACCAAMAGSCGAAMGQEHGCCKTESPRLDQQVAAASRIQAPVPHPTLVGLLTFALPTALHSPSVVLHGADTSPPTARGVPTYLLISTLRI